MWQLVVLSNKTKTWLGRSCRLGNIAPGSRHTQSSPNARGFEDSINELLQTVVRGRK